MTLQGSGKFEITQSKYRLSEEQKNGDGQKLFDFCAECLKTFVETNIGSDDEGPIKDGQHLPLGFTVSSFSCHSYGAAAAIIWTISVMMLGLQIYHILFD